VVLTEGCDKNLQTTLNNNFTVFDTLIPVGWQLSTEVEAFDLLVVKVLRLVSLVLHNFMHRPGLHLPLCVLLTKASY